MYEFEIDLSQERRSFRAGDKVFSLVLETAWWQALESVCSGPEMLKSWVLEWIEDAKVRGCNRQALIRYRIHQFVLDEKSLVPAPNPKQEIMDRIEELRKKHLPWRKVAAKLNEEDLGNNDWTTEVVKGFYYMNKK